MPKRTQDEEELDQLEARDAELAAAIEAAEAAIERITATLDGIDADADEKAWQRAAGLQLRHSALEAKLARNVAERGRLASQIGELRHRVQSRADALSEARRLLSEAPTWGTAYDLELTVHNNAAMHASDWHERGPLAFAWLRERLQTARARLVEAGESVPDRITIEIPLTVTEEA